MGLFSKKADVEFNLSKKVVKVNKLMSLDALVFTISHEFEKLRTGEKLPIEQSYSAEAHKITLKGGWTFHSKTIDLYKQKDNKRYKHIRKSQKDFLQSEWKII